MIRTEPTPGTIGERVATGDPIRWNGTAWGPLTPAARYAWRCQRGAAARWLARHCAVETAEVVR